MSDNFGSALTVLARAIVAPSGLRARGVPRPLKELPDLPKDLPRRLVGIRPKDVEDYLRGLRKFFHGILEFVDDLDQTDENEIKLLRERNLLLEERLREEAECHQEVERNLRATLSIQRADLNNRDERIRLLTAELEFVSSTPIPPVHKEGKAALADPAEAVSTGVPPVEVQKEEPSADPAKSTQES